MIKYFNEDACKRVLSKEAKKPTKGEAIKGAVKKGALVVCASVVLLSLSGCTREVSTNAHIQYDVIDTVNSDISHNGIQQVIDVPGEDFKLVVTYRCVLEDNAKWTVTSDKEMYMDVCTDGLPEGKYVYIDNVHIDTTIRSVYPSVDGITQDTMDDRIHNSQMIGFPIADDNSYSSVNCIEGQNQTFMQGSFHGFNGYSSGTISERRYIESDYLKAGVYANKINSVIDLIIMDHDGSMRCVSVPSTVGVSVWPYVERIKGNGESVFDYYFYNESTGTVERKEISAAEYQMRTEAGRGLGK
ncbi:MAG: hypothetical protein IKP07_02570 [Bacilli bacterium]|nr:hypothetical protein [Bacilli bacterium]